MLIEQARGILQNIPSLYALLTVACLLLGVTFVDSAPPILTVFVPIAAVLFCVWRYFCWRRNNASKIDAATAPLLLKRMKALTIFMCLCLGGWLWSLLPYAGTTEKMYLAFFAALTGASVTILALSRPRIVAFTLSIVMIEYIAIFMTDGNRLYQLIGCEIFVIFVTFFQVSCSVARRLEQGVLLQTQLLAEHHKATELAAANRTLALSDTLTGLPNRRHFFEEIQNRFAEPKHHGLPIIGLVDLDGFKQINDVFGHAAGDAVLVAVSSRLRRILGTDGVPSRLGGDEFAFILSNKRSMNEAREMAAEILEAIATPIDLPSGDQGRVSASIGFSSLDFPADVATDLLEQADFALYRAKESGVGAVVEFSSAHADILRREHHVQHCFKTADLARELRLVFQPVVDSTNGEVVRFEALARWESPELGSVSPVEFVAVAEKSGMTNRLTQTVLRKTIDQLLDWPGDTKVSLNLSAKDIINEDTSDALVALLKATSESVRSRITLEVTETSFMSDFDAARRNIRKFQALGLTIALDDFGTGFSSLRYLQELEFDIVKIDRSFVHALCTHEKSFGLVATIQQLCRNMSIECVIEGIETEDQLIMARRAGCRLVQGYYYAEPLEALEAFRYISGAAQFSAFSKTGAERLVGAA
ncbi:MAG: putative bifunctional diguanylate cyclase/phosphodiesterase [Pannonibacter sp.]